MILLKRSFFILLSGLLFISFFITFFNAAEATGAETEYEVLSPWAEANPVIPQGLRPRLGDLNGKTIGLYYHFKNGARGVLEEIEAKLKPIYPDAKFKYYQYPVDLTEIINDEEYLPEFKEWLDGVDAVITSMGDAGSCCLYVAYNSADIEKLGKPTVMLVYDTFFDVYQRGVKARGVPGLRGVIWPESEGNGYAVGGAKEGTVTPERLDQIIKGLTAPLTAEEKNPSYDEPEETKRIVFKGDIQEVNNFFYQNGWTNGIPIIPPTEEAVNEMLTGTDLPRDYVVAELPPMNGKATVEKIAVNAVMSGCLPTYMPVLIAMVKGMVDPRVHLEAWTCSTAAFMPLITISGQVGDDLGFNQGKTMLSPYYKPQKAIPNAYSFMVMNIAGVRSKVEDSAMTGHLFRFGVCIAEDTSSAWGPLHTDYGIDKDDSAVTMFWPSDHEPPGYPWGEDMGEILNQFFDVTYSGFFPGAEWLIDTETAQRLSDAGWSRRDVIEYIVEYCRRPASEAKLAMMKSNNHFPKNVQEGKLRLPEYPDHSTRVFWDDEHMVIAVTGVRGGVFNGGGMHGGPSVTKIDLPANWDKLVNKYKDIVPTYAEY